MDRVSLILNFINQYYGVEQSRLDRANRFAAYVINFAHLMTVEQAQAVIRHIIED